MSNRTNNLNLYDVETDHDDYKFTIINKHENLPIKFEILRQVIF